jgi:putative ABC transport system permease protein
MIKHYIKQAWTLLRQEKLFSSIYIVGTGLSITVVMVLSIVYYIKIANIYPETNRDRMLVVRGAEEKYEGGGYSAGLLSLPFIETTFMPLENAEAVCAIRDSHGEENYVQPEGSRDQWPVAVQYVDTGFWEVFTFRFLQGRPFSGADFLSGIPTAVVAESLAKRLYGAEEATGRYISFNFQPHRICGVVKDVSYVTGTTYAQLWIPYSLAPDYNESWGKSGMLGRMKAYILAPSTDEVERVKQEAIDRFRSYAAQYEELAPSLTGQPDRHWQSLFRFSNGEVDFNKIVLQYGFFFLVLLIVPAISLSGMADSRMERRLAEMGVRRAFGAPRSSLMGQVISENFLFTLLGGGVGLLCSYLLILFSRSWVMGLGQSYVEKVPEGTEVVFTPGMLLNMPVFGMALAVCFLLNLLSALIPAWKVSHQEIVYSLNT